MVFSAPTGVELAASLFHVLIGTVFPFIIILGSNLVIIDTLRRASKERVKLKSNQPTEGGNKERESQHLTVVLIFVSVAYIVTSLPYRMYDLIFLIPEVNALYDMTRLYWRLRYGVGIWTVMNIWFYNYAVNFYLYCIGGGKRYRNDTKEVMNFLICSLQRSHTTNHRVETSGTVGHKRVVNA
jgi:hypothetical protein